MKNCFFNCLAALLLSVSVVQAQTPYHESPGGSVIAAAPSSSTSFMVSLSPGLLTNQNGKFSLGADVSLMTTFTNRLKGIATTGVTHYFGNFTQYYGDYYYQHPEALPAGAVLTPIRQADRNIIPLEIGLRFYLLQHFYLQGQAGVAFGMNGKRSLIYTPAIGLSLDNGLDIGVKYDGYKNSAFPDAVSLKIGYQLSH